MHDRFFLTAILASKWPLFLTASREQASTGKWPPQLVSDIARAAVLFAIRNVLPIATQPTMRVLFAPLTIHHMRISRKAA